MSAARERTEKSVPMLAKIRTSLRKGRTQMKKRSKLAILASALFLSATQSLAGVDITGTVPMVWVASDGNLWFTVNSPSASTYCLPGWAGFSMFIPKGDPNFVYYYGLLVAAVAKAKPVYVANISTFNGTTPCDISKTGYGLVLLQ